MIWHVAKSASTSEETKHFLDIKWPHWIWIVWLYLSKSVALVLFLVLSLWQLDAIAENMAFFDLLGKTVGFAARIILVLIIAGVGMSIHHLYTLVSDPSSGNKNKFIKACQITGHILLVNILWFVLIKAPILQLEANAANEESAGLEEIAGAAPQLE